MRRFTVAATLCGFLAVTCPAQDPKPQPKWEPPATPSGWKAVVSKDGTYRFVVPQGITRSGTRDHTMTINRVRVRSQVNYFTLKDGTTLEVEAAALSGAGLAGVKVADVFNAILDGIREDGSTVSDPKDVNIGEIMAKEYRVAKDKSNRRMVMFAVKPRIFILSVGAADVANLDTETADTFLKARVLVPAEVVKAAAKERAAKDAEKSKENQEKYGFKWTTVLKDMTPPDAPAVGVIRGREFKPDSVRLRGGRLVFRQGGTQTFADIEVSVVMFLKGDSIENKTYEIAAAAINPTGSPHIQLSTMPKGGKLPKSESFLNRYA